jgi:hypothetical protein
LFTARYELNLSMYVIQIKFGLSRFPDTKKTEIKDTLTFEIGTCVVQLCLHELYYCFILIISSDVYCHMFTTAHVTRDIMSPATGIAVRIL